MARVPYEGVQEVLPELQAPQDYQNIQASPASFGAPVAQGLQEVGQSALKLSDFYDETAANQAVNNYNQTATNILRGNPQTGQQGYFQLRGQDAMNAYNDTAQQLDDALQETRGSLRSPYAQKMFDNEARRYRAQYAAQIGEHNDAESKTWGKDTADTTIQLATNTYVQNPNDPFAYHDAVETVANALAKKAQLAGEYRGQEDAVKLKAQQTVAEAGVRTLIGTDPSKAKDYLEEHSDVLASLPNYDQITRQVKEVDVQSRLYPAVDQFMDGAKASAAQAVTAGASLTGTTPVLRDAILGQESGNRDNIPISKNGAIGPGQILPQTFAQYARPGEVITNSKDNRAVAGRIVDDYTQRYNGDVGRIATAYFSGPNNVAPAGSTTPWIHDVKDANGKSVSSYVSDVQGRVGGQGASQTGEPLYLSQADALNAMRPQLMAKAQQTAKQLFPDNFDAQNQYVVTIGRKISEQVTWQDDMYKVNAHIVQGALASDHPPTSMSELLGISPQVAGAFHAMQVENSSQAKTIENMFDANSHGKQTLYGSNFKSYLDRAAAGPTDPDRISNSAQLWPYVGTGADSPLTNSGATALSELMANRGTPQGEAYVAQVRQFMDTAHANLTYSNPVMGVYDEKGEAAFAKFAAQALPVLNNAYKNGTIAKALDPKSPDYVGNMAQPFMRKSTDVMKEQLERSQALAARSMPGAQPLQPYTRRSLDSALNGLDNDAQRQEALKDAVKMKRISRDDAAQLWVQRGFPVPGGAPAKLGAPASPVLQAPQKQTGIPGYSDH